MEVWILSMTVHFLAESVTAVNCTDSSCYVLHIKHVCGPVVDLCTK